MLEICEIEVLLLVLGGGNCDWRCHGGETPARRYADAMYDCTVASCDRNVAPERSLAGSSYIPWFASS